MPLGNNNSKAAIIANTSKGTGAAATANSGDTVASHTKPRKVYSAKNAATNWTSSKEKTEPSKANGVNTEENQGIASALTNGLNKGNEANK